MSLCQVLQIYVDHTDGVWSNEKPALCFRGHKHMHCVVIGYPIHVVRRPAADFDSLRPTSYGGKAYPVEKMVAHLRRAAKHNGITVSARKLLDTVADGKRVFPVKEEELQLTEEDDMIVETMEESTPAEGGKQHEEADVGSKSKKAPKGAKKTKPAKVPVKKAAKEPKAKKPKGEKKPKAPGIGDLMRELIKDGKTNDQVLAAVKKKFPDSQAKASSVAWHRCQMKKK